MKQTEDEETTIPVVYKLHGDDGGGADWS